VAKEGLSDKSLYEPLNNGVFAGNAPTSCAVYDGFYDYLAQLGTVGSLSVNEVRYPCCPTHVSVAYPVRDGIVGVLIKSV
jgi:hypothetical protein